MANSSRPEIVRRRNEKSAGTLVSFPATETPHTILFVFKEYNYAKVNEYRSVIETFGNSRNLTGRQAAIQSSVSFHESVELPFPKQLSEITSLRLTGFERDAMTETITDFVGSLSGLSMSDAGNKITGFIQNQAKNLQNMGANLANMDGDGARNFVNDALAKAASLGINDAARAASYLLRNILPGTISRTVDLVTGQAINPKEALAFEGVNLRSFSFSWEMYPSTIEESNRINRIVNIFKRNALPETQDLALIKRAFLKYPSTVEIRLLGIDQSHFPQYKPCMIGNVSVDYGNGGTIPIMRDGKPGSVTLSVDFQEMAIHTREDVQEENLVGPF